MAGAFVCSLYTFPFPGSAVIASHVGQLHFDLPAEVFGLVSHRSIGIVSERTHAP